MGEGERCHWAWGYKCRLPDEAARRALAQRLGALFGTGDLLCRPLPALRDARIPEARIEPPANVPGSGGRVERACHTYGKSYFRSEFASAPDWVAYPESEAHIEELLAFCARENVAAVPFGGGTSVVGGVEGSAGTSYRGVISIDLGRLDRVLEVDPISLAARIQAGARGPALEAQLAPHELTLRHYPQSFEFSTLGGWIATRAGGHFATLYTHIDDLVESIRMVTPTGIFQSRRLPASGAGPAPDRLVLGSEGIFGVITEAWVRVRARPRWRVSASARFPTFEQGVEAARGVAQSGLHPANCRLLDSGEAMLHGVSGGASAGEAVLLLGFESSDHALEPWIMRALELAKASGVVCSTPVYRGAEERKGGDDASSWRQAFFDAPYLQSALVTMGAVVDTFETACTWGRFPALHQAVTETVHAAMKEQCGTGFLTCRFTHVYPDGPAPYYTFIAPGRDGDEVDQWAQSKRAASNALLAHGATITHHHAVGRLHWPWYAREQPEPFGRALVAAKRALDPHGVMNPGVLVDADRAP